MIPYTTPSASATTLARTPTNSFVALTLPFKEPIECSSYWHRSTYSVTYKFRMIQTVFIPMPISSCYPSGWDSNVPKGELHLSPGVCPSGWTYYNMNNYNEASTTHALCCNRFSSTPRLTTENLTLTTLAIQWIHPCKHIWQDCNPDKTLRTYGPGLGKNCCHGISLGCSLGPV